LSFFTLKNSKTFESKSVNNARRFYTLTIDTMNLNKKEGLMVFRDILNKRKSLTENYWKGRQFAR
jgi:hypothetical protein